MLFNEQVGADKPLFLDEPDEYEAGEHADDVVFGRYAAVGRELRDCQRALEPLVEFLIELLVERVRVQGCNPRIHQPVEVRRLAMPGHPSLALLQMQFGEDVGVRAVGVG